MSQLIPEESSKSWIEKLTYALLREPQDLAHLLQILRDACERNLLDQDSLSMVEGVIRYSELRVRDIMLPRSQTITINIETAYADIVDLIKQHGHSRYPVYKDNFDNVKGILHVKELFTCNGSQANFNLEEILRPVNYVPESKYLNILLTDFKRKKNHVAIVVDEYGRPCGFVTIEDVIEQIVGDIEDEFDNNEDAYIKQHSNSCYIIKAQIPLDDFNDYFKLSLNDESYETLGGLIVKSSDHMPNLGEIVKIDQLQFKILNADNRRIKLVEFNKEQP